MVTMGARDMAQMLEHWCSCRESGFRFLYHMELIISHNRGSNILLWPPQALCTRSTYIHAEKTLSQNSSRPALELPNWFFRQKWIPTWVNIINYSWVISEVCIANSWKTTIFKKVWRGLTLRLGVDNLFHGKPAVVWGWNDSTGSCVCTLSSQLVVLFWKIGELSGDGAFLQEGWALAFHSLTTSCPLSASWYRDTVTNCLMLLLPWLPAMPAMTVCIPF